MVLFVAACSSWMLLPIPFGAMKEIREEPAVRA
jgi:hypothetical protein